MPEITFVVDEISGTGVYGWRCPTCQWKWEWGEEETCMIYGKTLERLLQSVHDHVERGHKEVSYETLSNEYVPVVPNE